MTKHVRTSYRRHRRATWGLATALVLLIAAVAIPIASGAADKTFTLTLSSPVCNGGSITVTIANTAKTQTLGSIEVYFPEGTVASTSLGVEMPDSTRDPIRIDNINLAKGNSTSFTVTLNAGTGGGSVTAVGKQSNTFNDTQGGANLFESPSPQSFTTVTCGTVSGRVYHDRNADSVFTTGTGAFDDADVPKAWTVEVYAKSGGTYPSSPSATTTSSASTGEYSVSVPFGPDYKICVKAAGTDASSAWALQSPTGNALCDPITPSSNPPATASGHELLALGANQTGKDFVVVPVTGVLFGAGDTSTVGGYTVTAGTNSTKPDARYAHEAWVDSSGRTNFRFAPLTPCAVNCSLKLYLFETLTADVNMPIDGQIDLLYDDVAPFQDGDLKEMPYCLIDPRQSGGALATSGVLPGTDTSCVVEGSQAVIAGGKVHVVYKVYTALDGGRQIG